jgi:hypothetical protein
MDRATVGARPAGSTGRDRQNQGRRCWVGGGEERLLTDIWTTLGWAATTGGSKLFCI